MKKLPSILACNNIIIGYVQKIIHFFTCPKLVNPNRLAVWSAISEPPRISTAQSLQYRRLFSIDSDGSPDESSKWSSMHMTWLIEIKSINIMPKQFIVMLVAVRSGLNFQLILIASSFWYLSTNQLIDCNTLGRLSSDGN